MIPNINIVILGTFFKLFTLVLRVGRRNYLRNIKSEAYFFMAILHLRIGMWRNRHNLTPAE